MFFKSKKKANINWLLVDIFYSSKIINRFLKKYCLNDSDIVLEHPTRFKLKKNKTAWDEFIFYYDAHQGDISLEIKFNLV